MPLRIQRFDFLFSGLGNSNFWLINSWCEIVQMKTTQQYFSVWHCLFLVYFGLCEWNPQLIVIIQMKLMRFRVMLFIMFYKVVLVFHWSSNKILKCGLSNRRFWAELPCNTICYALLFGACGWNPDVYYFNESYRAVLRSGSSIVKSHTSQEGPLVRSLSRFL